MMFGWIKKNKRNILETGLLEGMTDIHSHLLPGVDDGVQSKKEAIGILKYLASYGVKRSWLPPHIMADLSRNEPEYLQKRLNDLMEVYPKDMPELRLAGEYMLDARFKSHYTRGLLTLANRRVLVETSYLSPPLNMGEIFRELCLDAYTPIIAHPERYLYMEEAYYFSLKRMGCLFQLNLMSLSGLYGKRVKQRAYFMLKKGLYDFLGTDIHQLKTYQREMGNLFISVEEENLLKGLLGNNTRLWTE